MKNLILVLFIVVVSLISTKICFAQEERRGAQIGDDIYGCNHNSGYYECRKAQGQEVFKEFLVNSKVQLNFRIPLIKKFLHLRLRGDGILNVGKLQMLAFANIGIDLTFGKVLEIGMQTGYANYLGNNYLPISWFLQIRLSRKMSIQARGDIFVSLFRESPIIHYRGRYRAMVHSAIRDAPITVKSSTTKKKKKKKSKSKKATKQEKAKIKTIKGKALGTFHWGLEIQNIHWSSLGPTYNNASVLGGIGLFGEAQFQWFYFFATMLGANKNNIGTLVFEFGFGFRNF